MSRYQEVETEGLPDWYQDWLGEEPSLSPDIHYIHVLYYSDWGLDELMILHQKMDSQPWTLANLQYCTFDPRFQKIRVCQIIRNGEHLCEAGLLEDEGLEARYLGPCYQNQIRLMVPRLCPGDRLTTVLRRQTPAGQGAEDEQAICGWNTMDLERRQIVLLAKDQQRPPRVAMSGGNWLYSNELWTGGRYWIADLPAANFEASRQESMSILRHSQTPFFTISRLEGWQEAVQWYRLQYPARRESLEEEDWPAGMRSALEYPTLESRAAWACQFVMECVETVRTGENTFRSPTRVLKRGYATPMEKAWLLLTLLNTLEVPATLMQANPDCQSLQDSLLPNLEFDVPLISVQTRVGQRKLIDPCAWFFIGLHSEPELAGAEILPLESDEVFQPFRLWNEPSEAAYLLWEVEWEGQRDPNVADTLFVRETASGVEARSLLNFWSQKGEAELRRNREQEYDHCFIQGSNVEITEFKVFRQQASVIIESRLKLANASQKLHDGRRFRGFWDVNSRRYYFGIKGPDSTRRLPIQLLPTLIEVRVRFTHPDLLPPTIEPMHWEGEGLRVDFEYLPQEHANTLEGRVRLELRRRNIDPQTLEGLRPRMQQWAENGIPVIFETQTSVRNWVVQSWKRLFQMQ